MNEELLSRDALIQIVAIKNGFVNTNDDPLLVTLLLNHEVFKHYQNALLSNFESLQINLDVTAERHLKQVKADSEHYVNQTLNALMVKHGEMKTGYTELLAKERIIFNTMLDEKISLLQKWVWVGVGVGIGIAVLSLSAAAVIIALGW